MMALSNLLAASKLQPIACACGEGIEDYAFVAQCILEVIAKPFHKGGHVMYPRHEAAYSSLLPKTNGFLHKPLLGLRSPS